jgi:hypothetical protein
VAKQAARCRISLYESQQTLSTQLNDVRELEHASDILRGVSEKRAASASVQTGELYPPTVTSFQYPRPDLVTTFVASLSATEDDLSQWCMYGDAFSGIALGFDSGSFVALDLIDRALQPLGFFKVRRMRDKNMTAAPEEAQRAGRGHRSSLGEVLGHIPRPFGIARSFY